MSAEANLKRLGIALDPVTPPVANYVNAVRTGNLLFLSGKGPAAVEGLRPQGKLGREFGVEQGYKFARSVGLALLAVMKSELGSLDRVIRVVKVLGMVNAEPDFGDQPKVINGCSDLFVEVFGERGRHARSAVGMGSLPMGIPVEIEVVIEVAPARRSASKPARGAKKRAATKRRR
ncbi:MAG: RidA family protein [Betaproteobacteria bacterium]|jgi:enamine deaminase RidA (YjgF/YER057c/UK114 family)|nr:RidA family protein [Betaproteobacteria bacterium]